MQADLFLYTKHKILCNNESVKSQNKVCVGGVHEFQETIFKFCHMKMTHL